MDSELKTIANFGIGLAAAVIVGRIVKQLLDWVLNVCTKWLERIDGHTTNTDKKVADVMAEIERRSEENKTLNIKILEEVRDARRAGG